MSTSQAVMGPRPGLANVVDIVIAPNQAFERLRIAPTWGWAFLVAMVLGMLGLALMIPASIHALQTGGPAMYAANPAVANLSPDKQQAMIAQMVGIGVAVTRFQWLFVPVIMLVTALIASVVMLIANAIGRGDGSFKKLWALAITGMVVTVGIGLLLTGVICVVRGPNSFVTPTDVQRALPSLALFAPGAGVKTQTFLGALNIVQLWGLTLYALGMTAVARIPPVIAWVTAILLLLAGAAIGAAFAR